MPSPTQTHKSEQAVQKPRLSPQTTPDVGLPGYQAPAAIVQRAKSDPRSLTSQEIGYLQQTIGNRAVDRLLTQGASAANPTSLPLVAQRQEAKADQAKEGTGEEEEADPVEALTNLNGLPMPDMLSQLSAMDSSRFWKLYAYFVGG